MKILEEKSSINIYRFDLDFETSQDMISLSKLFNMKGVEVVLGGITVEVKSTKTEEETYEVLQEKIG